ncbi:aminotransferase class III-fold pyridoxal phosphate-dependent enzyme [Croceivirga thetidis]|uniref:Aminotransferase class III-fold pyridoxal phosphate-dependent enzyme n=1 Tax=Croceivirga thetidis TaxID=2721623 RepID=A0ABX1GNI1_9FLAO|nr:aminotransferase class III-fold pyridoxal phosphate-dependent enzyme [Croceivirga thetidis]NKI31475.1 aminotransferase class III-fold pyridoxal phosphate-dependent enzyme [Croceivirga thetidis]
MNAFLKKEFGFSSTNIKTLNGYDNKNYLVDTDQGKFIFKTYTKPANMLEIVSAENEMLLHLKTEGFKEIPEPVAFSDGNFLKTATLNNTAQLCRMLTFVNGAFMADVKLKTALVSSLGRFIANLTKALQNFDHVALRARKWEWDLQHVELNKEYVKDIKSSKNRNLVRYFFQQYEQNVIPHLHDFRTACIHNDLNEWNILVRDNEVTGIIDFGDCTHTYLINEIAITATYVFYRSETPLQWVEPLLRAYHEILPIQEKEVSALYYLIAMRLCTSVCNSAHAAKTDPSNEYASISETKAWNMLEEWLQIGSLKAENCFRSAVGYPPIQNATSEEHLTARKKHISDILSISYKKPIAMQKAAFQYMFDASGNTFLDAYNNIPHVGHQHPLVVEAAMRQMNQLNTNTRYLYAQLAEYAEQLLAKFPSSLNKVFFVNSGSAASDLAIRLAICHTKSHNIMVMEHGYHGNSQIGIDISDYKFSNTKGQGQKPFILKASLPDEFRSPYAKAVGENHAQEVRQQLDDFEGKVAAFIAEPVVGCGGQVPLAPGYLKAIYPLVREQGGVCISDEVQTGFGRLGDVFWGFEKQNVVPDIVILGKPMGNGHPIGAVVTTDEIAASFEKGVEFFSSFGGNPVSCEIGKAVLGVIAEEELQKNAFDVGNYYMSSLKELQKQHPEIGDIRGSGLFIGVDIVVPGTKEPNTKLAQYLKNELREKYILVSTDGPFDNVIKSKPPLCFSKANVDQVVDTIQDILRKR